MQSQESKQGARPHSPRQSAWEHGLEAVRGCMEAFDLGDVSATDGQARERSYDRQTKGLLRGLALGAMAWSFCYAPLLFSVNPLPIALLGAADRGIGWILGGLALGFWRASAKGGWLAGNGWLYVLGVIGVILLRLLFDRLFPSLGHGAPRSAFPNSRFKQGATADEGEGCSWAERLWEAGICLPDQAIYLRVMAVVGAALIPCFGIPLRQGFAFYDLYGAVFSLLLLPLITPLMAGAWQSKRELWRAVGCATLWFGACYCARAVMIWGMSPVLVSITLMSLWAVYRTGIGGALVVALLGGLALDVKTLPMLLVLCLVYGVLVRPFGGLALAVAVSLSLLCPLLIGGTAMLWEVMLSLVVGALLFCAVCRLSLSYRRAKKKQEAHDYRQDETAQLLICEQSRNEALCRRLSGVASAFGSLSEVFRTMGETQKVPDAAEIRRMFDEICDEHCPSCSHRLTCWTDEYSETARGVRALSRQLAAKPNASAATCLSDGMRRRCPHLIGMMQELTYRMDRCEAECRGMLEAEVFAQSYDSISHLLRDILHEVGDGDEQSYPSPPLSEAVAAWLGEHGIRARRVCVAGRRSVTVRIYGVSPAALVVSHDDLRQALSDICGVAFGKLHYDGTDEGCLTLYSLPPLCAEYSHVCLAATAGSSEEKAGAKPSRQPCGDTVRVFEGENGMFYALLCDGMGSGHGAALTSGPAAIFMERVLKSGVSVGTALHMLNQYLRARAPEQECSTTVDLLALDLYTGEARLIKCGAAPTFLLREGRVHRVTSHTVPLGILQAVDALVTPLDVCKGDCLLMVSDGITDASDGDWVGDFIASREAMATEGDALVDALIAMARSHGSLDDISAICIHIGADH